MPDMLESIKKLFNGEIISVDKHVLENISTISNVVALKECGIFRVTINFKDGTTKDCVLKSKSTNVVKNGIKMLSSGSLPFRVNLLIHHKILGYDDSPNREISVYESIRDELRNHFIEYYGSYYSDSPSRTNLLFKYYDGLNYELDFDLAEKVIDTIVDFHVLYYNKLEEAQKLDLTMLSVDDYKECKSAIRGLYNKRHEENIKIFGEKKDQAINRFIDDIDNQMAKYQNHKTFTHNDFSTRNIFVCDGNVLFYDFELASYQNPEHDLIEFLAHEMHRFGDQEVRELILHYKEMLFKKADIFLSNDEFNEVLLINAYEFISLRLSMLRIVGEKFKLDFINDLLINSNRLLKILGVSDE